MAPDPGHDLLLLAPPQGAHLAPDPGDCLLHPRRGSREQGAGEQLPVEGGQRPVGGGKTANTKIKHAKFTFSFLFLHENCILFSFKETKFHPSIFC